MNATTATILALGVITSAFIAFFIVFRSKGKGEIKGPFGIGLKVEGANQPENKAGLRLSKAQAGGDLRAQDRTGLGLDVEKVKAQGNIDLSSFGSGDPPHPKN